VSEEQDRERERTEEKKLKDAERAEVAIHQKEIDIIIIIIRNPIKRNQCSFRQRLFGGHISLISLLLNTLSRYL
jgi:hypothetical protein